MAVYLLDTDVLIDVSADMHRRWRGLLVSRCYPQ